MRTLTTEWTQEIGRRQEGLVALRRDFHRHPELSFEERRTAEIIAERLHAAKLDVRTGLGRTGVVGVLHGDRPGRTVAWRADIDALPLTETFEAPFTSSKPGVMHACGHDGHTAIAITLAEMLAARRRELPGTAVFVFQPAEEVFGGAAPMIAAGVLDDIAGRGGHGAYPHLSIDPITAAANILLGMQNLVSREVSAHETAVLTVGQILGGTKHNIIPATAVMRGSLRTFDETVREQIKSRLAEFASGIARAYRTEARLTFEGDGCPAVVNHARETAFVRECVTAELGAGALNPGPPVMASDDMSLFLNARPGCYFRVGIAPREGGPYPHHAPEYQMNEDGLPVGLRVGLTVMLNALAG